MTTGIPKKIKSIQCALMSPQEIRKISATKIITADTYNEDGFPIERGLMDTHLGVIEPGLRCKTCMRKAEECPGHFGHIELAMPVIHVGYTKVIKALLRATCGACGRILMEEKDIKTYKRQMNRLKKSRTKEDIATSFDVDTLLSDIRKATEKTQVCPHCSADVLKITLDKPTTFRENQAKLTPKQVRERLEAIPDDDARLLGINTDICRPEWMVLTVLPVPPVTTRPSITLESGERSEDDLTHKLVDVLRINQRLQENRDAGAPQLIVEDLWELLQYHITTHFDNQTSGIPPARHRSGRPLKTLAQRLKGKEGRFRSNLSGKRVNFSARTVISPDPLLSINEVGVPMAIATELTVPIRVTAFNIEHLRRLILHGPDNYPGVNYLIRTDQRRVKITERNGQKWADDLEEGFIVERHLIDGDIVLFNRQPSLHRMSMMAHKVRIIDGRTFRFNLAVCPPYNADFDGDEMNLHALQSEEARAEAEVLMLVQEHLLSPRFGGAVIGGIHDHISGMFMLTHKRRRYTRGQVMYLFSRMKDVPEIPTNDMEEDGVPYWTGIHLASQLLPDDLNVEFKASICSVTDKCKTLDKEGNVISSCLREKCASEHIDAFVKIESGVIKCGTLDEKSIGSFKGVVLDRICREHGLAAGRQFIDNITKIGIAAVTLHGFSTSIDDEDIPDEASFNIDQNTIAKKAFIEQTVAEFGRGTLQPMPGRSVEETLEVTVMKALGEARDDAGRIAGEYLGLDNSAVIMAKSGARGSMLNLSQMAGLVGQQAVRGERISRGYTRRTLPHYAQGDLGSEAKGFVENSYKKGLTPTEFFFHAMGGREGLVDTAVRTSRSGYMQRRLINALEDLKVDYDRTIKNTAGRIIQFIYGEDGVDPTKSDRGSAVDLKAVFHNVLGVDSDVPGTGREVTSYAETDRDLNEFESETDDLGADFDGGE